VTRDLGLTLKNDFGTRARGLAQLDKVGGRGQKGHNMSLYLWIALGGAIGSAGRFGLAEALTRQMGAAFPWGTLVVNVAGSFVIGFFATITTGVGRWPVGGEGRHFFMTGVLGGFTTFSSFSLQTLGLMREGEWARAGGNVAGSVGLCLAAVWLGHLAAAALNPARGT
jgi:CrcB protein